MRVIAFGHRKRTGKDTACKFLTSFLRTKGSKYQINKGSFAYELKLICHQLYGWDGLREPEFYELPGNEDRREDMLPTIGKTVREVWIEMGTSVGRHIYESTWVDILFSKMKAAGAELLLISDLRFPNEAQRVTELGGMLVKIERPEIPDTDDVADNALVGFDGWDAVITNTDMDGFYADVTSLIERFNI